MQRSRPSAKMPLMLGVLYCFLGVGSWRVTLPLLSAQTLPQWGTPTMLEAGAGEAQFPRLAADESGTAIAVWAQYNGSYSSIWANRFVVGHGWEGATLI